MGHDNEVGSSPGTSPDKKSEKLSKLFRRVASAHDCLMQVSRQTYTTLNALSNALYMYISSPWLPVPHPTL